MKELRDDAVVLRTYKSGESDRVVPVGQLGSWQSYISGASACTLPGVGHLLFDESPEAVEAIDEFALRYADG